MTIVVDASVAVKWVLPEDGAERAAALRHEPGEMLAPSPIIAEIGNAVWKRVSWKEVSKSDALRALEIATQLLTRVVPISELATRALELAIELRHPFYDCLYLALAERERCPLVSADAKLLVAAKRKKTVEVRAL